MSDEKCDTFWGGHGCDLPDGHDGPHICDADEPDGPCSEVSFEDGQWVLRFWLLDDDGTDYLSESSPVTLFSLDELR